MKWTVCGIVLLFALTAAMLGAIQNLRARFGQVAPGVWLTAVRAPDLPGREGTLTGILPGFPTDDGTEVDAALRRIITEHPGRWFVGTHSAQGVPDSLGPDVHAVVFQLDSSVPVLDASERTLATGGEGVLTGRRSREQFDGILLAPVRPDHSHAWRFYNEQTLRDLTRSLHPGGVGVLRMRIREGSMGTALRSVRSFCNVIGPCWIVLEPREGEVDLIVAGPKRRIRRPPNGQGLIVVSSRQLWYEWRRTRPLTLFAPGSGVKDSPDLRDFVERMESLRQ